MNQVWWKEGLRVLPMQVYSVIESLGTKKYERQAHEEVDAVSNTHTAGLI